MSPDRSSTQDVSTKILTQMPIERSHIILQQQQQPQQFSNININNNNNNNVINRNTIFNLETAPVCSNSNDLMTTTISTTLATNSLQTTTTTTPTIVSSKFVMNEMSESKLGEKNFQK